MLVESHLTFNLRLELCEPRRKKSGLSEACPEDLHSAQMFVEASVSTVTGKTDQKESKEAR